MQKQQIWPFALIKNFPYAFTYLPEMVQIGQEFMNPFLGYPNCPLIGRYNHGEYRIADTKCHLQFRCRFHQDKGYYACGQTQLRLPQMMVYNLRNIPEIIKHNKPPNQGKNSKIQNTHPMRFPVLEEIKFVFIITFGQIGKDFLNYLNHMYTLGHELFVQEKLRRSVQMLPIYAYLPQKSGFMEQQVDKGLNLQNYRSEYLSLHLKYGAPAFSPNNMRLGVDGMKKVVSNPAKKKHNKFKQNIEKGQNQGSLDNFLANKPSEDKNKQGKDQKLIEKANFEDKKNNQKQDDIDWDQMQKELKQIREQDKEDINNKRQQNEAKSTKQENQDKQQINEKSQYDKGKIQQKKVDKNCKPDKNQDKGSKKQQTSAKHKGFMHFYTSVLLQKDYRVYYHWHIDSKIQRRQLIQMALISSKSLNQFLLTCRNLLGFEDECVSEACRIFGINN